MSLSDLYVCNITALMCKQKELYVFFMSNGVE